jgi:hypothetical protein
MQYANRMSYGGNGVCTIKPFEMVHFQSPSKPVVENVTIPKDPSGPVILAFARMTRVPGFMLPARDAYLLYRCQVPTES